MIQAAHNLQLNIHLIRIAVAALRECVAQGKQRLHRCLRGLDVPEPAMRQARGRNKELPGSTHMRPLGRFVGAREGPRQRPTADARSNTWLVSQLSRMPGIAGRIARFDNRKLLGQFAGFRYAPGLQIRIDQVVQSV